MNQSFDNKKDAEEAKAIALAAEQAVKQAAIDKGVADRLREEQLKQAKIDKAEAAKQAKINAAKAAETARLLEVKRVADIEAGD